MAKLNASELAILKANAETLIHGTTIQTAEAVVNLFVDQSALASALNGAKLGTWATIAMVASGVGAEEWGIRADAILAHGTEVFGGLRNGAGKTLANAVSKARSALAFGVALLDGDGDPIPIAAVSKAIDKAETSALRAKAIENSRAAFVALSDDEQQAVIAQECAMREGAAVADVAPVSPESMRETASHAAVTLCSIIATMPDCVKFEAIGSLEKAIADARRSLAEAYAASPEGVAAAVKAAEQAALDAAEAERVATAERAALVDSVRMHGDHVQAVAAEASAVTMGMLAAAQQAKVSGKRRARVAA